jgi:hypothetical protein
MKPIRMAVAVFMAPEEMRCILPDRMSESIGEIEIVHALPMDRVRMHELAEEFAQGHDDEATRVVLASLGEAKFMTGDYTFVWDHMEDPMFGAVHVLYVTGRPALN